MKMEILAIISLIAAGVLAFPKQAGAALSSMGLPDMSPERTINSVDIDTLARTIWGEARGEGYTGMQAVANVIMNRYRLRQAGRGYSSFGPVGASVRQICTAERQFSAWNINDPNRPLMLSVTDKNQQFRAALQIARKALSGELDDITGGADHYHATSISPYWSKNAQPVASIGSHLFYQISNTGVA